MSKTVTELWKDILNTYDSKISGYSKYLNKGVTNETYFNEIENKLGISLPEDFKELYRCNDGDTEKLMNGSMLGLRFMTIQDVYNNIDTRGTYYEEGLKTKPANKVKKYVYCRNWLPFVTDEGGNFIGIDFEPDTEGTLGQIISFGRDECTNIVIANSLKEFLELVYKILNSNHFKVEECSEEELEEMEEEELVNMDDLIDLNGFKHALDYLPTIIDEDGNIVELD